MKNFLFGILLGAVLTDIILVLDGRAQCCPQYDPVDVIQPRDGTMDRQIEYEYQEILNNTPDAGYVRGGAQVPFLADKSPCR